MKKLVPIKCEVRRAPADKEVFHLIEKKTGKDKLVAFGRVFPIEGTKRFLREIERTHGVKVVNAREFIREIKDEVKRNK